MPPGRITPNSHVQRCRLARRAEIRDGGCTGRDPIAGSCGLQPFGETAVVGGELADTLLERGVLGGGPLNSLAGEFAFGVAGLIGQLPRCGRAGARISAWAAWRTLPALSARFRPDVPARLLSGLVTLSLGGMRGPPSRTGQPRHLAMSWLGLPGRRTPARPLHLANQSEPPQVSLPVAQI